MAHQKDTTNLMDVLLQCMGSSDPMLQTVCKIFCVNVIP